MHHSNYRAPILVHFSCTTRTIMHPYSCTAQSRAPRTHAPYCTYSYSCTSRAPLKLSCIHTCALLNLVHLILVHPTVPTRTRALLAHHSNCRAPILMMHCSISCTSYSCTLLHLLVLMHLSCTTRTIVHPYSCPTQSRAPIKPTRHPTQEGSGPSPWLAQNIPVAIVNLLTPSATSHNHC